MTDGDQPWHCCVVPNQGADRWMQMIIWLQNEFGSTHGPANTNGVWKWEKNPIEPDVSHCFMFRMCADKIQFSLTWL